MHTLAIACQGPGSASTVLLQSWWQEVLLHKIVLEENPQQPVLKSVILHHFRVALQPWCWCVLPQGTWRRAAGVSSAVQGYRRSLATGTPVSAVSSHTDMNGIGLCFEISTQNLKTRFQRYQREAPRFGVQGPLLFHSSMCSYKCWHVSVMLLLHTTTTSKPSKAFDISLLHYTYICNN